MSFFKVIDHTVEIKGLICSPNSVSGPNGLELRKELKDTYQYPVSGWYWFETFKEAKQALLSITETYVNNFQLRMLLSDPRITFTMFLIETNKLQSENKKQMLSYLETDYSFKINHPLIQFIMGAFNLSTEEMDELLKRYEEII